MASVEERIRDINYRRLIVWERGKELLERASQERRELTAEESANFDRVTDDVTKLDMERETLLRSDEAQREFETVNEAIRRVWTPEARASSSSSSTEREMLDFFKRGSTIDNITINLNRAR